MQVNNKSPIYVEIEQTNHIYGANHIIRKYVDWPDDLPLPIIIPHNPLDDFILNNIWIERNNLYKIFKNNGLFATSKIHLCGHPILYLPEIKEKIKRKGTLCVPRHPVNVNPKLNRYSDSFYLIFDDYCKNIINLPQKFHPLTVCLCATMEERSIPICNKYKLKWVASGKSDAFFYYRLRDFMLSHEYVTSYTGTPMWLALYWGCKFFYTDETDIKPYFKQYQNLFTKENAEQSLSFKDKKYILEDHLNHLGEEYKKTKEELREIMKKCSQDINYQLWTYIYKKENNVYFMRDLLKKIKK